MARMFVEEVICFSIYIRYIRYYCVGLFEVSTVEVWFCLCLWLCVYGVVGVFTGRLYCFSISYIVIRHVLLLCWFICL